MSTKHKTRHAELREQFDKFHAKCPALYVEFERRVFAHIAAGDSRVNPCAILSEIRNATRLGDSDPKAFRVNSNFGAFYGRMFRERNQAHASVIRTKAQPSKKQKAVNLPPLGPQDFEDDDE